MPRIRVAIVGCGFAGLAAARRLAAAPGVEVTVFNPRPELYNYPVLPRHLVDPVPRALLAVPLAPLLPGVRLRSERVEAVDAPARRVETASGTTAWDFLILAVGVRARTLPRGERTPLVFPKSERHLARLRGELEQLAAERRSGLVCIVGGGLTGIEFAAAVRARLDDAARRHRRRPDAFRVLLLERGARLAPDCSPALAARLAAALAAAGVGVRTGCAVHGIEGRRIETEAGALEADITLCCAGAEPDLRLGLAGLDAGADGIACTAGLVAQGSDAVLVAGDIARPRSPAPAPPRRAAHARRQGAHAAANVLRLAAGRAPRPYRPRALPTAVYLGPRRGLVALGPLCLGGSAAARTKHWLERDHFRHAVPSIAGGEGWMPW
ncbi:FAD-dependent oxidoreductase [Inmirania thermothiophila]|uniref:NADH dehydrogenase n=1 Tax=Inmirania thermothiophila TaxID=1750597 RepID=A0A3N1Y6G1_9GAMM|nr:FAD-dependent oxidoreductase [Inmirania thermothiophila]ROR32897.1 NADH dehydrogenase [Inmirania thermothiophila]